ncbi:hypothetical protein [Leptolyngbya sp. PCC 6406]|uniref:hypothetical protein n=1 Tax=Leptolyngbya sp. PCC 6406 TaxID=1173264 RepID=UPI0002ACE0F5|nr:hypothetical protein [Leptolyngbya sp. PCC 6406]
MDTAVLSTPFEPAALAAADTATLKATLLKHVEGREAESMAKKVRFANETLMPLFHELAKRNPIPDLHQQIPLLQGLWVSLWSTNPFQDILPGRVHDESYQIFDDSGYYANLARYKPGRKTPILNRISRWLLSYDLLIMQSYRVQTLAQGKSEDAIHGTPPMQQYWEIQNVCIQQALRIGSRSFSPEAAQIWLRKAIAQQQSADSALPPPEAPQKGRLKAKQYQQIAKARPQLDNLYIDSEFRLVKTQREKSQRPSYTVAIRKT